MSIENVLALFKIDLSITHDKKDDYFLKLIKANEAELKRKGIILETDNVDDEMLLSDYSAWQYRNRMENEPMPNNIQYRLRNRIARKRSGRDG